MKLFDKLFKSNRANETVSLTTIARTKAIEGFLIPGIINNMKYFFTDLQVYSDGLIYCWDMVDLDMFKDKLDKGWVVTSIPDGETISFFSLGNWKIEQGNWLHTKETLYGYVYSLVNKLNPTLQNLHNYKGSNTKIVNGVNVAKHAIPNMRPYHFDAADSSLSNRVYGEKFNFFYRSSDAKAYLVNLSVYKSGKIEITNLPQKKILKIEDLDSLIKKDTLTTDLKTGEIITILNLGSFKIISGNGVGIDSKIDELYNKFNEMNGKENTIAKCARIFELYKQTPTKALREGLRDAYEAVPKHQRMFVGTMDTKDYEVRLVIYGDIVKKEWEDYYGYDYPYEDMPKPIDE